MAGALTAPGYADANNDLHIELELGKTQFRKEVQFNEDIHATKKVKVDGVLTAPKYADANGDLHMELESLGKTQFRKEVLFNEDIQVNGGKILKVDKIDSIGGIVPTMFQSGVSSETYADALGGFHIELESLGNTKFHKEVVFNEDVQVNGGKTLKVDKVDSIGGITPIVFPSGV